MKKELMLNDMQELKNEELAEINGGTLPAILAGGAIIYSVIGAVGIGMGIYFGYKEAQRGK